MNQADVRDRRVRREQPLDVGGGRGYVLGRLERRHAAPHHLRELREALAVGAVDQDEQVAVARDERVDRALDREGAAALHRHAHVRALAGHDVEQALAHDVRDRVEVRIPRPPVAQHRHPRRQRRGQRTWREQDRVAAEIAHGNRLSR